MSPICCRPKVNAVKPHLALERHIQVGIGVGVPSIATVLRFTQKLPDIRNVLGYVT